MTATPSAAEEDIAKAVREHLAGAVDEVKVTRRGRIYLAARKETVREVAVWLQGFGFDHTIAVSGVDHPTEKKIEVLYFLSSYSREDLKRVVVSLTVQLDRENPSLPTLTPVWESANFFEREAYEMFGVNFEGHPNLQKLLLQDNWDGPPPLRKDLKIPEMA
jgi:NADH-quinone oxidoreductase subunit C